MAQWIRICLPMQGTWVQSLGPGDSTYHRATKPVATATEPTCPRAHAPQQKKPWQGEAHVPQLESSPHDWQKDHVTTKTQNSQNKYK